MKVYTCLICILPFQKLKKDKIKKQKKLNFAFNNFYIKYKVEKIEEKNYRRQPTVP